MLNVAKSRRQRRIISCLPCRRDKAKCDRLQPCNRCSIRGVSHMCHYADASSSSEQRFEEGMQATPKRRRATSTPPTEDAVQGTSEPARRDSRNLWTFDRLRMGPMESYVSSKTTEIESMRGTPNRTPDGSSSIAQQSPDVRSTPRREGGLISLSTKSASLTPANHSSVESVRSMVAPSAATIADVGRAQSAHATLSRLFVPYVPGHLAMGFLEDYLRFYQPLTGLLRQTVLEKATTIYCSISTAVCSAMLNDGTASRSGVKPLRSYPSVPYADLVGDKKITRDELVQVLLMLALGSGMHAVALQSKDQVRDEALLRVYNGLSKERTYSYQPSRDWLSARHCSTLAADLYTSARFLIVEMENEEPTLETVRILRLFASANHSQNLWMGFTFGSHALFTAMAIGLGDQAWALPVGELQETEMDREKRRIYILCSTFDYNIFRFKNLLPQTPLVDADVFAHLTKSDAYMAQLVRFDAIAQLISLLPTTESSDWAGHDDQATTSIRSKLNKVESKLTQAQEALPNDCPLQIEESSANNDRNISLVPRSFICMSWTFLRILAYRPYLNLAVRGLHFSQSIYVDLEMAVIKSAETAVLLAKTLLNLFEADDIFYKFAAGMSSHIQRCACSLLLCLVACQNLDLLHVRRTDKLSWLDLIRRLANVTIGFLANGDEIPTLSRIAQQLCRIQMQTETLLEIHPTDTNEATARPSSYPEERIALENANVWEMDASSLLDLLFHDSVWWNDQR